MKQHPALEFLAQLDSTPDARFNIEHFTDRLKEQKKPKHDPLARRYADLTLAEVDELLPKLQEINERGAGVFVTRNECSGHRRGETVSRVRGIHADMDDITPEQLATVCSQLAPSIIVNSSGPGRYQLYWQLAEGEMLNKEEAKAINQTLVGYGADPAAVDVSRLLRLPGFNHMKYRADGKTPVVTAKYFDLSYSAEEIRQAFPPKPPQARLAGTHHESVNKAVVASQYAGQPAAVKAEVAAKYPDLWSGNWRRAHRADGSTGYPSSSEADLALAGHVVRACRRQGIDELALPAVVEAVFGESAQGRSEKWIDRADYRQRTILMALRDSTTSLASSTNVLQLESHGDIRNARAFTSIALGKFVYVSTRDRWLRWDGERWHLCEKDEHVAKAKAACGEILAAAGKVLGQDQERGKRLVQEAVTSHSLPRIMAMLKLAASEPGMAVTERELDGDPYVLGVTNGVVDLRTGHCLFNQPEMFITRYCNAAYDEDAKCVRWLQFLDQVFEGDSDTIGSVQRLLGCTLLGLPGEEVLVICYGHGSNGKSVFSNVVHTIMGGYAVTAPPSLLTARKANDNSPRNDIAAIAGARYVSINEMQAGDRLDEQVVKSLAGREPISARFLHQEYFEFLPSFTPWLRTNHKPIVTGEDDGIWRRLVLLRFGKTFTDEEKDPKLEGKLLAERDGVLMWMIEGARKYLTDGLKLSPRMKSESATYRTESDMLGEFLSDQTVPSPAAKTNQKSLYEEYREWCDGNGVRALSKKSFTQRLSERGYPEGKSGPARYYCGLLLAKLAPKLSQGGVGRISADPDKSSHENSIDLKLQNGHKSCPTCPDNASLVETSDEPS